MTDQYRGTGGAVGPPWSVDLLADLHAGVLDENEAAELWPRVEADPEARAILEALDATSADLADLTAGPVEPMPAQFAARLDAAVAQEARDRAATNSPAQAGPATPAEQPVAPVVSLDAARRKRNKRIGWGAGILTAAAAAVAAIAIAVPAGNTTGGDAVAQPTDSPPPDAGSEAPLALQESEVNASAIGPVINARDFGPLENEQRLDACLEANGIDPTVRPAGIRGATIDGSPATLVVLTTGQLGQFRLVALSPSCGPGTPGLVFDKTVG